MICEECGKETDGIVCRHCGLEITSKCIAYNNNGYPRRREDVTTLYAASKAWSWDHPLSPKIRKRSKAFVPRYQKTHDEYIYIKAYENIKSYCSQLNIPEKVMYEGLNLFKRIIAKDQTFFKRFNFEPTYLACIKIACKIHDFPIMNHELASVTNIIDENENLTYMTRKFNMAYKNILRLFNISIKRPEHPNFINYACNKLDLPYSFTVKIHEKYNDIRKYTYRHFKLEGYILALMYIYGCNDFNITKSQLAEVFHTSVFTITNRKNEILNMYKVIIIFNNGDKKVKEQIAWIDYIGKIIIHGALAKEKEEFDWDDVKEIRICR